MARNVAHYIDPEEEKRRREEALLEAFGPPAPPPNLGVAPAPRLPLSASDLTTPRMTDRGYRDFHDPYQDQDPTAEELAADEAEDEAVAPRSLERRDPISSNPYDDAPPAVDKRAASVSEEQKGVPASRLSLTTDTGAERGWADDLLETVKKRVIDKPELGDSPVVQKAGEFASQALDPREGFSRERQAQRAAELYGEDEPPSRYWEDELLSRRSRITDKDVQRGFLLQSLMSGNEHGMRFREMMRREQAGFEQDLEKARAQDYGTRRISRGMAEAIAATGQVSPEAAVRLTYNDPLVKNFGQFASQGGRAEGQALGREKAQMDLAADLWRTGKTDDRVRALSMLQSLTTLGAQEMRAQMMSQMTPEQIEALKGSWMASHLRVDPETGAAAARGDTSKLTPEQARKAELARPAIEAAATNPKVRDEVLKSQVREAAGAETREDNAVQKSISLAQNDRKYANKWQNDWTSAQMPLKEAIKAWKTMSPEGQKAFSAWASNGAVVDQFAKAFLYAPGDQVKAAKVREAINSYVKANAGSAVTGSEWDRMATRVGIPTGTWAPFNDPEVVGTFLSDAAKVMTQNRQDYERIMGGWK